MKTRLVSLRVGGTPAPWNLLGLNCSDSSCDLAGISLELVSGATGLLGWQFEIAHSGSGIDGTEDIDGIPTVVERATTDSIGSGSGLPTNIGSQKVVGVDHVVVNTDNLDRTCSRIGHVLGLDVRRSRDAGNGVEQRFFKLENTIVEVVSGPHVRAPGASLWGLVVSVDDLFELAQVLGPEVMSAPKRATQPGRYISTVRQSAGLGVALAMMSPHVPGMVTH